MNAVPWSFPRFIGRFRELRRRRSAEWAESLTEGMRTTSAAEWKINGEETALLAHHYQIADVIEKGPLSVVYRAIHRNSSKPFTVKSIDLHKYNLYTGLTRDDIDKEIEICASLKHRFMCELRDVIAGDAAVHMVFDFLEGQDICFEIVKRASAGFVYSEAVASHYMRQLFEALNYMHSQGVIHRDIRPHNIILASKDNSAPLKVRGFGVAVRLSSPDAPPALLGRIGTPQFMAPEVVADAPYGTRADLWSAGVLLYLLLSGRPPFVGSKESIYESIEEGRYSLSGPHWSLISNSAKDLLMRLLTVDPNERFSAAQCLEHSWILEKGPSKKHLNLTVDNIRKYNQRRKLKSNVLSAVNNTRWSRLQGSRSSYSILSGDSMPGGDTCDADGCTRKGPVEVTNEDITAVDRILTSLDQIAALTDQPCSVESTSQMNTALEDKSLNSLLMITQVYC
ncbi:hypothetical protein L596_014088 [Steinernema carpocapsae]|uniref:Protein kinase domain-containing protein n=1 Tax=Steinernema carpocapsae TaxID=34508 RepID=A0A4U5NBQ2_STECR|nr:hypothetical protein L596_014088 [Steinernema carpocapsae]